MSEPAQVRELLEHRAANWLNGLMYYGLVSLLMLVSLWSFLGSFSEVRAIIDAPFFPQDQAPPREASAMFALGSVAMLLRGWRKRRTAQ